MIITNEEEHKKALARVDELIHLGEAFILGDELDLLVDAIVAYEELHDHMGNKK